MKSIFACIVLLCIVPNIFAWNITTTRQFNEAIIVNSSIDGNGNINYATYLNPPYLSETMETNGDNIYTITEPGHTHSFTHDQYQYIFVNKDYVLGEIQQYDLTGKLLWDYQLPQLRSITYHPCGTGIMRANEKHFVIIVNKYNVTENKMSVIMLMKEHTNNDNITLATIKTETDNNVCRSFTFSPTGYISILYDVNSSDEFSITNNHQRSYIIKKNTYLREESNMYQRVLNIFDVYQNKTLYSNENIEQNSFVLCASEDGIITIVGKSKLNLIYVLNGKVYTRVITHPYIFGSYYLSTCTIKNNMLIAGWNEYKTNQNAISLYQLDSTKAPPLTYLYRWKYLYPKPTGDYNDMIWQIYGNMIDNKLMFSVASFGSTNSTNVDVYPQLYVFDETKSDPIFTAKFSGSQFGSTVDKDKNGKLRVTSFGLVEHATIPSNGGKIVVFID